ncbi:MAG: chromate transporter [Burkholderiales bacterium]|nr:chromate transporter [Burkholderiales bacterium]
MPATAASDAAPGAPRSRADLFWSFSWIALQGFGGVMAVVQRELVERKRWLTREQFVEDWAVAQIMPGPNVVNLSMMIGDRHFGLSGALVALVGMLALPSVLVLLLAAGFASVADAPMAQGALRGMGAVAAALIIATGLKLIGALRGNPMGRAVCLALVALTVVAMLVFKLRLALVLGVLGGAGCLWAWRCLRPAAANVGEAPRP